jgi:hypothetical protein
VERLVRPSRKHDEEDIEFWRNASDELRGKVLHDLLMLVNGIGHYPEKEDMFPGLPNSTRSSRK